MKQTFGRRKRNTRTLRSLVLGIGRRRAVSTIIGGMIILTLILSALGTMVFVSQQYDQYQQTANKLANFQLQSRSESITPVTPGLKLLSSGTVTSWGTCSSGYNCYNLTVSNVGGVGIQIVRIYINSTSTGCTTPCVLNPTAAIASYAFNQGNQFINTGEVNHGVLLALPSTVLLPSTYYSQNTVFIVTSRGTVFSFKWPLPMQIFGGQSQSAFSTGILKIAYLDISGNKTYGLCYQPLQSGTYQGFPDKGASGCDSSHDYNGASGNTSPNPPYCHNEPEKSYVAPTNYAEQLTGITGLPTGNTLYFVNPWVTLWVLEDARTDGGTNNPATTQLYIYINITNTGSAPYAVAGGSLDLFYSGSTHIDGTLIGIYYNATGTAPYYFSASSGQKVAVGKSFYAIFQITLITLDLQNLVQSSMYWGALALTSNTEGTTFVGGVGLSSGLWIRWTC